MLGRRPRRRRRPTGSSPWKPANLGLGDARGDPRVLARALGDAAPARVARDVEHRREDHARCRRRRPRPRPRVRVRSHRAGVERRGLGKRDREDRAVAVDHVEAEEQRECRAASPPRRSAGCARTSSASPEVDQAADAPARIASVTSPAHDRSGDRKARRRASSAGRSSPPASWIAEELRCRSIVFGPPRRLRSAVRMR